MPNPKNPTKLESIITAKTWPINVAIVSQRYYVNDLIILSNSFFEARVDISSIKTSNATRDKHLNAPNYFHSEKYPEIIFKSDSLYSLDNKFRLKGKLTIKEITQSEEIQFSYNDGVFNGTCIIYSNDYKIHKRKTREDSKILIKITVPIL